ncbi:pilus assembly protein CpaF [Rhodococcus triatomae]|uniref:Pilus assembly protein CpaF n=1 Tax=Rhodococcus triatomae TaxID=300028 RepID=A0A1G8IKL1_9NOCA|nr:pilus assembly protein CpaF [Rhodococcus triatomae]
MGGVSPLVNTDLLDRVRDRLAQAAGDPTPATVAEAIRSESGGVLGDADLLAVLRELQTELTGAGPLEAILAEPGVSDVLVTGPDQVWVDRGRGLERAAVRFADEAAVRRLGQRLALAAGRRLDDAQPWVDGRLGALGNGMGVGNGTFGVRLHAVLAPVAQGGTCLSLRVLRPATQGLEALRARGTLEPAAYELLVRIVRARLAFLVVGGTGAGKTTLLAALLGEVDPVERIVCVEDAAELAPAHPHVVRLVARAANVEGVGEVTIRDLVRQSLRMRPDRLVVGEVRGPEVVDLLTALNTGHDGGAGTVHANSPDEVPARLEALAALGGLDRAALHSQLAAALQVVLHVHRGADGRRRLVQVGVVSPDAHTGRVTIVPAWTVGSDRAPGAELLRALLERRGSG